MIKSIYPPPADGPCVFFCANLGVVQTNLQPRRAVGLCSRSAITKNATLSAVAHWCAGLSPRGQGQCLNSLCENFENSGFGGFSKMHRFLFGRAMMM